MFGQSRLLQGLLCETNEAVAAQVMLWDRSTVWHAGLEQAARTKLAAAATDYLHEKVVAPVQRARKTMTVPPARRRADVPHQVAGHVRYGRSGSIEARNRRRSCTRPTRRPPTVKKTCDTKQSPAPSAPGTLQGTGTTTAPPPSAPIRATIGP